MEKYENTKVENINWEEARNILGSSILILDKTSDFLSHNHFVGEFDDEVFEHGEIVLLNNFYEYLVNLQKINFFKLSGIIDKLMMDDKFKKEVPNLNMTQETITELQRIIYEITNYDVRMDETFKKLFEQEDISDSEIDNYYRIRNDIDLFKARLPRLISELKFFKSKLNG